MQSLHVWFSHGIGDSKSSLYVCYESPPIVDDTALSTLRQKLFEIINFSENEVAESPLMPAGVIDAIIMQDHMSRLEVRLWELIQRLLQYVRYRLPLHSNDSG